MLNATSQFALNKGFFFGINTGKLFVSHFAFVLCQFALSVQEIDDATNQNLFREKVDNGIVLRAGLSKGVRVIKNGDKSPKAALVLDSESGLESLTCQIPLSKSGRLF